MRNRSGAEAPTTRAVTPDTLKTPEASAPPLKTPEDAAELRRRLFSAVRQIPPVRDHFAAAWAAGRDAAVDAVEAGRDVGEVNAMAVPDGVGCRDCWRKGREAALRAIVG